MKQNGMRIAIALGGNALGNTPQEQIKAVKHTAKSIVQLVLSGNKVIIGHGNGPQVGMINLGLETAHKENIKIPVMPFPECGAMSQGYIGYHLQNALRNEFDRIGRDRLQTPVATVVTQVVVDKEDVAFQNPTKPIGSFYTKEEAEVLAEKEGYQFVEDAGRGYRRVVPSPKPLYLVEEAVVRHAYDCGDVIIAGGGGGIPVIETENGYEGVAAVIDKDFTTEKLAELVDADVFVILTAVDQVAIRFGKEDQQWLDTLSIEDCEKYIADGEFAKGSMLPKIEAAMKFVQSKEGRKALITSLEKADDALSGNNGTWIS